MPKSIYQSDGLRSLSALFTTSAIRRMIEAQDYSQFIPRVTKHSDCSRKLSVRTLFERYYRRMETHYRSEYVFKNALLNQKLLAKHSLSTTSVLNEFRIGTSVADFVLLNGEIRVFEIKTDFDTFDKLDKQLGEYRKVANRVYLVVGERGVEKALSRYRKSSVGIIRYTDDNILETVQSARSDSSLFNAETLFKTLRKPEYSALIQSRFGYVPAVPNTQTFQRCLQLAQLLDPQELQDSVRRILKKRTIKSPELLQSGKTPVALKHICYSLDLSRTEYLRLFDFLDIVP